MKDNEEMRKLFKRYLEGKTTRNEEDVLFRYLSTSKGAGKQLSDLVAEAWANEPSARNDSPDVDDEFEAIMLKAGSKQRGKIIRLRVLKYAASVILICSVALGWYSYQKNQPRPVASIQMYSRSTAQGEKLKITLSDSTVVYLGGSSKLTWPARFVKGHYRNVRLEGEGFFEVKRDTLSPFIVYSGNIQTRVLGTSFNITAYSAEKIFSVAVRTGKVRVSESTKKGLKILSLLTHGMKLDYNNQSRLYLVNTTDENEINGWTTNRFVFNDVDLQLMLGKLERYYKVRFDLKSPCLAGSRSFNATFNQKSVKEIMEQIKMMSGGQIKYKINSDTLITVWGEGCK